MQHETSDLRRWSRRLQTFCMSAAVSIVILGTFAALSPPQIPVHDGLGTVDADWSLAAQHVAFGSEPVGPAPYIAWASPAAVATPAALWIALLLSGARLLRRFSRGILFHSSNVRPLRQIAVMIAVLPFAHVAAAWAFDSERLLPGLATTVFAFAASGVALVGAGALAEGSRLRREVDLTI